MANDAQHPHGSPMTLGNMRQLGVHNLVASCLNDACRHSALIDVSSYPAETEVPSFRPRMKCASAGVETSTCARTGRSAAAGEPDRQGVAMNGAPTSPINESDRSGASNKHHIAA